MSEGILIAADIHQQWQLPWWWDCYLRYNNRPVAFCDLGLSYEAKEWCKERGLLFSLPTKIEVATQRECFSSSTVKQWEEQYGSHFWQNRKAWFKKPLACLKSPYKVTVWMDCDCEVKGSLDPLFSLPVPLSGVSACGEYREGRWIGVNTGVLVFYENSYLIREWAQESLTNSDCYAGDQDVLTALIAKDSAPIGELDPCYNWSRFNQANNEALIVHWHGDQGKAVIKQKSQFLRST